MVDKFTYVDATYESPAESFSISNPYSFSPNSSQYKFEPSDGYNFSSEIPDSDITGYPLLWEPDSQFISNPESSGSNFSSLQTAESAISEYASPFSTENLAAPAAYISSSVLNMGAQRSFESDMQGNSIAGHSILASYQAQSNLQTHDVQNAVASTLVGVGAMFGPEGLAAGLIAGGAVSSMDFSSPVSAPTDTGETITSDQISI